MSIAYLYSLLSQVIRPILPVGHRGSGLCHPALTIALTVTAPSRSRRMLAGANMLGYLSKTGPVAPEPSASAPAFFAAGPDDPTLRPLDSEGEDVPLDDDVAPHGAFTLALLPVAPRGERRWALACGVLGRSEWSRGDRAVARSIAHALGIALERARLIEESERARVEAEILSTLSRTLELARTPVEVASEAVNYLAGPTRVESFILWRVAADRATPLGAYGTVRALLDDSLKGGLERPRSGLWQALDSAQPVYLSEAEGQRVLLPEFRDAGFNTVAHIPVQASAPSETADGPAYVLTCLRNTQETWSAQDARLLEAGAPSIGVALERARHAEEREAQAEKLSQQNSELEARNAEQETFVYTVSHDLRQPLLAIHGMADLLADAVRDGNGEESAFLLGRVTRNVEKMGHLLNDLLALSRASRTIEVPERLPLGDVIASVLNELEPRLKARRVKLQLPESWPDVSYPRPAAYQVLANILGNAAKFAGRKGKAPVIRVQWENDGQHAVIRICDNGPGIPSNYREKVFGLFQKMDAQAEGTGVGLAIVKRLAERNGGSISVEDGPLGGASFVLSMPLASPPEAQPAT